MDTVQATLQAGEYVWKPDLAKYRAILRAHPLGTRTGNPTDMLEDVNLQQKVNDEQPET
jgi:hypothetical protein